MDRDTVVRQLLALGVERRDVLVVHTSYSKTGPLEGGPVALIEALRAALGDEGTLVMPSMSEDDEHPFDRAMTTCIGLGIVAETFRTLPGVLRSDNPHAFSAIGPHAAAITAPHPIDVPHGLDSPPGRVFTLGGKVLLLGVGHDANTTIHVAENMAGMRYFRPQHVTVLHDGIPTRFDYRELDHCCQNFALLDNWLGDTQRRGPVGHAEARLMRSRDVVERAMEKLRENETVFLHEPGTCEECDDARSAL